MNDHVALRLYFTHSAKVSPSKLWHRLTRPALVTHLLHRARSAGIEQAIVHHVQEGYLAGEKVRHRHVEHVHHKLPQCLELIDVESKIKAFWEAHSRELAGVRAVFLECEVAKA